VTCPTGKRPYRSKRDAKAAHLKAGFRIRIYKCEFCRLLHVTNQDKGGRER
jgi:hypothetical protein